MKKAWKKYFAVAICLLIFVAIWASKTKPLEIETTVVKRGMVTATVAEKGKLTADDSVNIYAQIQGNIKKVIIKEGQRVEAGTVLAEIDTRDMDALIARLNGELTSASGAEISSPAGGDSQLQQRFLALEEAKDEIKQAQAQYERIKNLYNSGAATYVELEQAESELGAKRKSVGQAEAELALAKQQTKGNKMIYNGQKQSMTSQLSHLQDQKEKAQILADRSGVVLVKKIEAGDYVNQGSLLFTIGDTRSFKVETYLNTKDIANVKEGGSAIVIFKVPGKDRELPGSVVKVAPAAEEVPSALGISEYRVKVTVMLSEIPKGLTVIPGMEVEVKMNVHEAKNVLYIPKEVIFTDKGKEYVWVVRDGSAMPVEVVTGVEGDETTEINKGLSEKERLILDPHNEKLKEGIRIK